ncbi:hypothetical protein FS594_26995 (plasmid) [Rahnella aquatilis]|nr:hypothetical protein FS594_26995 [Rahnella aquatilis]
MSVNRQTRGVNIAGIHVEHGHGISIGSETANHIQQININNLLLTGTQSGICIKSGRDRGSSIELIEVNHVEMKDVDTPLVITDSYGGNCGYSENSLEELINGEQVRTTIHAVHVLVATMPKSNPSTYTCSASSHGAPLFLPYSAYLSIV